MLGADVYHAPPDSDRASFAAVVHSGARGRGQGGQHIVRVRVRPLP